MKIKYVILFLSMFFLVSCSTMKVELRDQNGRIMPDPHYVLQGIEKPITVLFYYTAYEQVEDVDHSLISKPVFLDFLKYHDIYAGKYKLITLTIEVRNPTNIEYSIYQQAMLQVGKSRKEMQVGGEINRSNLPYRQFVYRLPYGEDIRAADHVMFIRVDGETIMRIGNFRYNLIH